MIARQDGSHVAFRYKIVSLGMSIGVERGRLVSGHLGEGLLQLLGDGFVFLLLGHQLVLQPVHLHKQDLKLCSSC